MLRPIALCVALFLGFTDAADDGDPATRSCKAGQPGQYYPVPAKGDALWFPALAPYDKVAAEAYNTALKGPPPIAQIQVGSFYQRSCATLPFRQVRHKLILHEDEGPDSSSQRPYHDMIVSCSTSTLRQRLRGRSVDFEHDTVLSVHREERSHIVWQHEHTSRRKVAPTFYLRPFFVVFFFALLDHYTTTP